MIRVVCDNCGAEISTDLREFYDDIRKCHFHVFSLEDLCESCYNDAVQQWRNNHEY